MADSNAQTLARLATGRHDRRLAESGVSATAFPADIMDRTAPTKALRAAAERFGDIDVLEYSHRSMFTSIRRLSSLNAWFVMILGCTWRSPNTTRMQPVTLSSPDSVNLDY
ncbi:MAG TPA: hypothetical protein VHV82_17645 [Sporichthyaceae bacterium]|jgi:hypothetical protein|nr:hypothetical protein [Sporichthyaceae bacterium]